jgi:hypothetical protein
MTRLDAVRYIQLPTFKDSRGTLTAFEANLDIPFPIQRVFYVYDVQPPFERGGHAHLHAEQVIVCVAGSMKLDLSDGEAHTRTYELTNPTSALYVPAMIWTRLYAFTPGTVCLAGASSMYDHNEVIRSWDGFIELARKTPDTAGERR